MPTLLNFCRKYGWQLIMNNDLVEDMVEHYQLTLEGAHTLCRAPPNARVFRNRHWICDAMQKYQQYACSYLGCNNRMFGFVALDTFLMFWMSRSMEIESVASAFLVEVKVEVTKINFY